ncbi:MAG TPA: FtsX-like permease family protein [Steroidobacteraceae bacterium]|nr:FtsX-like permease family protein [Steroidobacteraceae bacterium]
MSGLQMHPILSALFRSRVGPLLVVIQMAVALMVLANAVTVAGQRLARINRPTGIDEANLFVITSEGFTPRFNGEAQMRTDVDYLRGVEGVVAVTATNAAPLGDDFMGNLAWTTPDKKGPPQFFALIMGDEHTLETWGTHLIAGRGYRADEIQPPFGSPRGAASGQRMLILSRSTAQRLFPDGHALGKSVFYGDGAPVTIVGVTDDVVGPDGVGFVGWVAQLPGAPSHSYLVRTAPGARDRVMREVEAHLPVNPDRVITRIRSLESFKEVLYSSDRNMTLFLAFVTLLMVGVTCLGVFGLATYNVSTRTRQIGTRRAVGARRIDILKYFLIENWMITAAGVVLGSVLAVVANAWLVREYSSDLINPLPPLDIYDLASGIVLLYLVGQLAAWYPARKAAAVSPAIATRTV